MEFIIVCIKDRLSGRFMQPIFVENEETAKRWFKHVLDTTEIFKDNKGDFELYKLGTFDDTLGVYGTGDNELLADGQGVAHERTE